MVIPGSTIGSIVVNGVFIMCGSMGLVEPFNCTCVTSSLIIGACTTMVDAWGASI